MKSGRLHLKIEDYSVFLNMISLKERLIKKIQATTNKDLLEEVYRLLENNMDDREVYKLSADQKDAIKEGQQQIKRGEFLTDEKANKEAEEWLKRK